jgi:hypothetical protein
MNEYDKSGSADQREDEEDQEGPTAQTPTSAHLHRLPGQDREAGLDPCRADAGGPGGGRSIRPCQWPRRIRM